MRSVSVVVFALAAAAGLALGAPVNTQAGNTLIVPTKDWRLYGAPDHLPSHIAGMGAEVPVFQGSEIPNFTVEKRDGLWPWQKDPPVIGKYPDGRLKCRIVSMTAGHTEGPCPPKLSQEEVAELLHAELCHRPSNCCKKNGEPCGDE